MVWRDAELAQGELSFERYVAAEHVVMQPSSGRVDAFEGWFLKRYGVTRRVAVLTYSFITLPALLVGTNRVATVHERVARRLVHGLRHQRPVRSVVKTRRRQGRLAPPPALKKFPQFTARIRTSSRQTDVSVIEKRSSTAGD